MPAVAKSANTRLQREREAQKHRAQELARLEQYRRAQRTQRLVGLTVVLILVVATGFTVKMATGEKAPDTTTIPTLPTTSTTLTTNTNPPASLPTLTAGADLTGDTPCPAADGSSPRTTHFAKAPPTCVDRNKDYTAVVHTTKGDMQILLNQDQAPNTVNNFVVLARYHFYDGAPVTKIVPRGWMQFDDTITNPDGSKGPGYTIPGEVGPKGTVASALMIGMIANTDGTSGSAFLIGIADQAPAVPKEDTIFGLVLSDMIDPSKPAEQQSTVRQEIAKVATQTGEPSEVVTITSIDITEGPKTTSSPGSTVVPPGSTVPPG